MLHSQLFTITVQVYRHTGRRLYGVETGRQLPGGERKDAVIARYLSITLLLLALPAATQVADRAVTRGDILKGEYARYRSNNDLLHYDLHVRVDPDKRLLTGSV